MNDGMKTFGIVVGVLIIFGFGLYVWIERMPSEKVARTELKQINEHLSKSWEKLKLLKKVSDSVVLLVFTEPSYEFFSNENPVIPEFRENEIVEFNRFELPFWAQSLEYYGVISYMAMTGGSDANSESVAAIMHFTIILGFENGKWRFCYGLRRLSIIGTGVESVQLPNERFSSLNFTAGEYVGRAISEVYKEP